ncbi:MAG: RNA pyrophosphohydrolase [Gammaproteobacteria bacterium]|nr:RNA pyrophosphohydrolase [Gammaproteobacteria bacterium]
MIDSEGYRANVGIVLSNGQGQLFWARRIGMDAWQFPQGGIRKNESSENAMYRELQEETGLLPEHVELIGCTSDWLRYRLPNRFIRKNSSPKCIGQKQIWYLLKLIADENEVRLDACQKPEFDHWRWVDFWDPVQEVVDFKRKVYEAALQELLEIGYPQYLPKISRRQT